MWLEGTAPTENTKQLETFILSGGVYGSAENAVKVTAANGIGKTKTLLRWMFLSRDALQVLYPNLKKHPLLYPFYQIKRWFRIFNKSKRDKVKRLTDARGAVTKEQIGSTAELLRHLGLDA